MELSPLDRLVDPRTTQLPRNEWEQLREVKAAIRRDLTDLLNNRRAGKDFDPEFVEVANSLLRFGIPDFASFDLRSTADQEKVRVSIERAIRQFEPRLARVKVLLSPPDPAQPRLHFVIYAQLRDGRDAEDLTFDATVLRDSRRIAVTGAAS